MLLACALSTRAAAAEDAEATQRDPHVYESPSTEGLHWAETFDGDVWSRWTPAGNKEKFNGYFQVDKRRSEGLVGDVGLLVTEASKHYGVSASFPALTGEQGTPLLIQYEARFQDGLTCGGSYVKLFDRASAAAKDFDNETPYVIMFGPDRCGATDKVHFILKHRNPKTGVWEEKHFKDAPKVPNDQKTHLYGLLINPDNSFEIQIDGTMKVSGNLLADMEPPVNPPKDIDDPEDSKPDGWVDDPKMPDPQSLKPEDWDEDEPMHIPDPEASMPSGWLEDQKKRIADPDSKMPSDWDEEEDGEWEAPIIDNPACSIGCGKWEAPRISNPKYKGKWRPETIDNPDYKGLWKPRQVANPDYFDDQEPCVLPMIDSVGIDIWTMQGGILFDNFAVSRDVLSAQAFTEATFARRQAIEAEQDPSKRPGWGPLDFLVKEVKKSPTVAGIAGVLGLVVIVWLLFLRKKTINAIDPEKRRERQAAKKKKDDDAQTAEAKQDDGEGAEESAEDAEGESGGRAEASVKGGLGMTQEDS